MAGVWNDKVCGNDDGPDYDQRFFIDLHIFVRVEGGKINWVSFRSNIPSTQVPVVAYPLV